jgi:hypothetical protein
MSMPNLKKICSAVLKLLREQTSIKGDNIKDTDVIRNYGIISHHTGWWVMMSWQRKPSHLKSLSICHTGITDCRNLKKYMFGPASSGAGPIPNFMKNQFSHSYVMICGAYGSEYEDGCLLGCSTVTMEAVQTSEPVNLYQSTWRYNPEDSHLHSSIITWQKMYFIRP